MEILIRKDSMDEDNDPLGYEDQTSDAAFYDDLEESRSPSPIIIWRPAARVKVATDVPPELLQDLLNEDEEEQEVEKSKRKSLPTFHAQGEFLPFMRRIRQKIVMGCQRPNP